MPTLKDVLPRVIEGQDLSREDAAAAMDSIMSGGATPAQIGAFLVAMRLKGETTDEIAGCAEVMRKHATKINVTGDVIDTCGTGGDSSGTFNISTAAAFVAAGAGAKVAKHGNRSVSSNSGSADVLKTLGVKIDCPVPVVERCIEEARIGFLFAPMLHAAMKHAIGPRREIGVRTVFNILGPLTNPAGAKRQLMGVFSRDLTEKLAEVLAALGAESALVVAGDDGLDELSTTGPTTVSWVASGKVKTETLDAEKLGLPRAGLGDLRVEGPEESAEVIKNVLGGEKGPARDIVVLNAAGALMAADTSQDWKHALATAAESIDSGRAKAALGKLVEVSNADA
ncbi:MAG: anthranilate phosphoribosyltransferase [Planctomycetota bacterium]|jgi:anthranilate phosphoribosyltransferase